MRSVKGDTPRRRLAATTKGQKEARREKGEVERKSVTLLREGDELACRASSMTPQPRENYVEGFAGEKYCAGGGSF